MSMDPTISAAIASVITMAGAAIIRHLEKSNGKATVNNQTQTTMPQNTQSEPKFKQGQPVIIQGKLAGLVLSVTESVTEKQYRILVDANDCAHRALLTAEESKADLDDLRSDFTWLLHTAAAFAAVDCNESELEFLPLLTEPQKH